MLVHPALEDRALEDRAGNRFDRLFDRDADGASGEGRGPIRLPFRVESAR